MASRHWSLRETHGPGGGSGLRRGMCSDGQQVAGLLNGDADLLLGQRLDCGNADRARGDVDVHLGHSQDLAELDAKSRGYAQAPAAALATAPRLVAQKIAPKARGLTLPSSIAGSVCEAA